MLGTSSSMQRLYEQVDRVAGAHTAVLITGENGTGKELVARTLHQLGTRPAAPFVPVNCGAVSATVLEAELFGSERPGAGSARRSGATEDAAGGTLFLDEVGEMPLPLQGKLLQMLAGGPSRGEASSVSPGLDVRVIAATHRDLDAARAAGQFRDDLLYRLAAFPLRVPPLRERPGDIELLARYLVEELNSRERGHKLLSRRSLDALRAHLWPGNIRELRIAVHRAYILADRQIEVTALNLASRGRRTARSGTLSFGVGTPLADAQREILLATLDHFGGDKRRTARVLGISLKTLYNRLGLYGDTVHVRRRSAA
ncbi:MAG TPA: sigma-54 dependent transcriptional regulator [Verrucomicrobiae bacterium]|nr:sigma-54 dependent transcriptional regulator [Verrucomicrobiae bacterium]